MFSMSISKLSTILKQIIWEALRKWHFSIKKEAVSELLTNNFLHVWLLRQEPWPSHLKAIFDWECLNYFSKKELI